MSNDTGGRDQQDTYADPRDLRFGEAAKKKEEALDEALRNGEEVPDDEGKTPRREEDPSKQGA